MKTEAVEEQILLQNLYVSDCDNFDIINDLSTIFPLDKRSGVSSSTVNSSNSSSNSKGSSTHGHYESINYVNVVGSSGASVTAVALELPVHSHMYEFRYPQESQQQQQRRRVVSDARNTLLPVVKLSNNSPGRMKSTSKIIRD